MSFPHPGSLSCVFSVRYMLLNSLPLQPLSPNYVLRCVIPVVCRKTNGEVHISHENTTSLYRHIYMILFEQNFNNLKMAAIGRNM